MAVAPNGDLVAVGNLHSVGSTTVDRVARLTSFGWVPVGTTFDAGFGVPNTVAVLTNGHIVANGGRYPVPGANDTVMRWDGINWSPLGVFSSPFLAVVYTLLPLPGGQLLAGGTWALPAGNVARFDGSTWSALGTGTDDEVHAAALMPNGDIVVGGYFLTAGGVGANRIARWNGSSWLPLGLGMNNLVKALCVLPNGELIAGGSFTTAGGVAANRVARWNGSSWSPLGAGVDNVVLSLTTLPNGDVLAGGNFTNAGGIPANRVARWNGTNWAAFEGGVDGPVHALASLPAGGVAVGGGFTSANGNPSANFARLTTTCPATAVAYGAACNGRLGPVTLTASTLPWIGSTLRARATGFWPQSVGVLLVGVNQLNVPASSVFAPSLPGCSLLVDPNVALDFPILPAAGVLQPTLAIPFTTTLVGLTGYIQVAQLEYNASFAITQASSSNGLALTLGHF